MDAEYSFSFRGRHASGWQILMIRMERTFRIFIFINDAIQFLTTESLPETCCRH